MAAAPPDRSAPPRLASYEHERERYRVDVPGTYNPVIDIVERWAREAPDDLALLSLDARGGVVAEQTAGDLARESRRAPARCSASA
jgi:acetyl-CoA synthetase